LGIWETLTSDQKPDELVVVGKGMNLAIWQSGNLVSTDDWNTVGGGTIKQSIWQFIGVDS
jgi:hypothetical protein